MIRSLATRLRSMLRLAVPAALAVTAATASAGPIDGLASAPQVLSIRMNLNEQIVFTGAAPCFMLSMVQGTGRSQQLGGNITLTSTDCLNPHGTFDPNNGNALSFASQDPGIVITTSAGHKVYASYSGVVRRLGTMSGYFIVKGGTGPYYGATGGGLIVGHTRLNPNGTATGTVEALGTLLLAQ